MKYATYLKKQRDRELMQAQEEGYIIITITKTGLTKKQDCGGRLEFTKDMMEHFTREFLLKKIGDLLTEVENF